MKFYNKENERIYNNLTKEEQEVIKEELENNFFENGLYPHAKGFKIEKIEIIKEENEIYSNVHLSIKYDNFSVPHILKEREEITIEEAKKSIFENQNTKNFFISLIEKDLMDYLNRDEEILFGNYGRKVYQIFETLISKYDYEKANENYIFENLDKFI